MKTNSPGPLSFRPVFWSSLCLCASVVNLLDLSSVAAAPPAKFFETHCVSCHDSNTKSGGLDLTVLKFDPADPETVGRWIKVHDRIAAGEMPPKKSRRPPAADVAAATKSLRDDLVAAERTAAAGGRTRLRRLTRVEYENTVRDLFDLPGLPLQADLPADGQVHGFDKDADALDLSHVNLAKYLEMADRVLDAAIATRPRAPAPVKFRTTLAYPSGFVAHVRAGRGHRHPAAGPGPGQVPDHARLPLGVCRPRADERGRGVAQEQATRSRLPAGRGARAH
jgi:hypothetical protein